MTARKTTARDDAAQDTGPEVGTSFGGASEEELGAQVAAAQRDAGVGVGATGVDPEVLLQHIQNLQAQFDELRKERNADAAPVLTAAADQLAGLVQQHATGITTGASMAEEHAEGLRLADDLKEAARDALKSGDASAFAQIGGRLHRWLTRHHPGPGEHTYYAQAVDRASDLADIADAFKPPSRDLAVAGRPGGKVVAGSVVG